MRALERRYGRLLRAYPASYRRERGDEILSTLLEAASAGQGWPSLRDARALVMGGLRVRAAQNHRLGTATNLRLAALLGVALWLALNCALGISRSFSPSGHAVTGQPGFQWLVWPLVLVAVVLVWFAPRAVALAVPLVAAAASVVAWPPSQKLLEFTLALLALAALSLGRERPPRSWLWWLAAFAAWAAHPFAAGFVSRQVLGAAWVALIFAVLIALVLWIVVDARPAIALAVVIVLLGAPALARGGIHLSAGAGYLVAAAVLAIPALVRLRRQAVL